MRAKLQRSAAQLTRLLEKLNDTQLVWLQIKGQILSCEILNERCGTLFALPEVLPETVYASKHCFIRGENRIS